MEFAVGPYRLKADMRHVFHRAIPLRQYDPQLEFIFNKVLKPGDVYVDAGSEIGYFACVAGAIVRSSGAMVLFEPDPRAHKRLVGHIGSAGETGAPRTFIFQEACSDIESEAPLTLDDISGQSRIARRSASSAPAPLTVKTTTLDTRLREIGIQAVKLIKIDVEGHEIQAVRGMLELLRNKSADYIVVEKNKCLLWDNGFTPLHLHSLFESHGYRGATASGEILDAATLDGSGLDNLLYAKNTALLLEVFPDLSAEKLTKSCAPRKFHDEAVNPKYPGIEVRDAIELAANGRLEEAIFKANELIHSHPFLINLKGHLAYWLKLTGRREDALALYREILSDDPGNEDARTAANEMANA